MTTSQRLGKYELQERLGRGGMGEVWKAHDTQLRRYVAIKLLLADLQTNPNFVTHFTREAQFVASLHHPNIVQIHDFQFTTAQETGVTTAYMVMDYVEGGTLADYIRSTSRQNVFPSAHDIVSIFTAISLGLDYAHQKGMIHRDIKPANILVDKHNVIKRPMGEPILTDFGIAKLRGTTTGSVTSAMLGTPLYISPEQAHGQPGDERTDLYSLGIIMYEMLTGITPFRGENPIAIMMQHLHEMPTPPNLINPNIPPALAEVVLKSIAKDTEARFPTASAMTIALAQALNVPVPAVLNKPRIPNVETAYNPLQPTNPFPAMTPLPSHLTASPSFTSSPANNTGTQLITSPNSAPAINNLPLTPVLTSPAPLSPPVAQSPRIKTHKKVPFIAMALLACLIVLAGIGLGSFSLLHSTSTTPTPNPSDAVVGSITFSSSPNAPQGVFDQVQVHLQHIPPPPAGKAYYAWIDKPTSSEAQAVTHWLLHVNQGVVQDPYLGDAQHTNLLVKDNLFLITEEDASSSPNVPYPTRHLYYAIISQTSTQTFEVRQCPSSSVGNPCI